MTTGTPKTTPKKKNELLYFTVAPIAFRTCSNLICNASLTVKKCTKKTKRANLLFCRVLVAVVLSLLTEHAYGTRREVEINYDGGQIE